MASWFSAGPRFSGEISTFRAEPACHTTGSSAPGVASTRSTRSSKAPGVVSTRSTGSGSSPRVISTRSTRSSSAPEVVFDARVEQRTKSSFRRVRRGRATHQESFSTRSRDRAAHHSQRARQNRQCTRSPFDALDRTSSAPGVASTRPTTSVSTPGVVFDAPDESSSAPVKEWQWQGCEERRLPGLDRHRQENAPRVHDDQGRH